MRPLNRRTDLPPLVCLSSQADQNRCDRISWHSEAGSIVTMWLWVVRAAVGQKRSFQIIFQLPRILRVVIRTRGLANDAVSCR